jgi:hypothetical protein
MSTEAAAALIVTAIMIAASALGLPEALGAHPLWAVKTGLVGSGAGLLTYVAFRWAGMRPGPIAVLGGLMLVLSGLVAMQGKSLFVTSFAENALAGRFWYFGWLAVTGSSQVSLTSLVVRVMR